MSDSETLPAPFTPVMLDDGRALPYAPFPIPPYREMTHGQWRCWQMSGLTGYGYFTGHQSHPQAAYGVMQDGTKSWMTMVPMEFESQMPALHAAGGTVLVSGLGLAQMAYGLTCHPAVERVIVVERDPDLIALAQRFAQIDRWPNRGKLTIREGDMRHYRHEGPVDFLYVDIWLGYRGEGKVATMREIHHNNPAAKAAYWGQEVDALDWWIEHGGEAAGFDARAFQAFAAHAGLPLIGLEEEIYPALCRLAGTNPNIPSLKQALEFRQFP